MVFWSYIIHSNKESFEYEYILTLRIYNISIC